MNLKNQNEDLKRSKEMCNEISMGKDYDEALMKFHS